MAMPKDKLTKTVVGIAILILSIFSWMVIKNAVDIWKSTQQQKLEEQKVLTEVAQRIGIAPSWKAVRNYLYCDALQPGLTQTQVENVLGTIGPYFKTPYESGGDTKEVDFENSHLSYALSPLMLHFSQGRLVSWGRGESNFGPRSDCE